MTREPGLPIAQGLYNPAFEHDSCGVGFVVHLKGAIEQGIGTTTAFRLPIKFRPNRIVFVPVDCVSGRVGRLNIFSNESVNSFARGLSDLLHITGKVRF